MRILVSRTDRLGDVVLTLPLCAQLKQQLGAEVVVLGRRYTRPLLEACPFVDAAIDWDDVERSGEGSRRALLAEVGADVIIHVFPRPAIARAAFAARIPLRIGTSHRWYHWLTCNALEDLTRKASPLHEAQLDILLARRLLGGAVPSREEIAALVTLVPRAPIPDTVAALIDRSRATIVLHPGTNGSAREWPLERWTALARALDPSRTQLLVTGSGDERKRLQGWLATLPAHVVDLTGRLRLAELIALLPTVTGLVAASTGPLHVAAAAGARALGLFVATPPIHPARWAPLGRRADVLVSPTAELDDIPVEAVAARLDAWITASGC